MSIEFRCTGCGHTLRTPAGTEGRKTRCPQCQTILQVPAAGTPPVAGAAVPPVVRPPGAAGGPASSGGARSFDFRDEAFGGPRTAAQPGGEFNPYASPLSPTTTAASDLGGDQGDRRGPPWESKRATVNSFLETAKITLFSPDMMFRTMRLRGGHGAPIWFMIAGGFIGGIAAQVYSALQNGLQLALIGGNLNGGFIAWIVGMQIVLGIAMLGICGMPILIVAAYVWAFISHVLLMVVGGVPFDDRRFEATFRVVCYTLGSIALWNFIPILGGCVGFFSGIISETIGYSRVHNISIMKSLLVVLTPLILCIGFFVAIFLAVDIEALMRR